MHRILRSTRALATATVPKLQDILVVGGGPAGLSVIAALKTNPKTRHLTCTLVEAGSMDRIRQYTANPPKDFTNRNISLSPPSIEFMHNVIGSWDHMKHERVFCYEAMDVYDSQDMDARVQMNAIGTELGFMAAQCEIINIQSLLLSRIDSLSNDASPATIIDEAKVESIDQPSSESPLDWPLITLDNGEKIQARLLIGADGYNSPVRHYADIESRGWQYDRFGVVAVLQLQYEDTRSTAWQRFLTTGTLGFLPLPNGYASIVWASPPRLARILMNTDAEIMPHLINAGMILDEVDLNYIYNLLEANPKDMTAIDEIKWRMSLIPAEVLQDRFPVPVTLIAPESRAMYPLKMAHADTYTASRVALVGDAAHTTHPLAGQGLNMGVADVAALVRTIERGIDRGMDIGSPLVLDSYGAERWPINHAMLGVCDKLHKLFSTDFYPIVLARGLGMKAFNLTDGVKLLLKSVVNAG